MSWDDLDREARRRGGSTWLRLGDGEMARVVFIAEPILRYLHWTGQKMEACEGAGCGWCARGGERPVSFRAAFPVWVPEDGGSIRVFEAGIRVMRQILALRKKWSFDAEMFIVTRSGTGKDTAFTIARSCALSASERKNIQQTELPDLEYLRTPEPVPVSSHAVVADDDVPF